MTLGTFLRRTLPVRRSPAPVRRALLDLDAGDQLTPTAYPYGPGRRPAAPFSARVAMPGRGERPRWQMYPPTGNPTQRTMAHQDYAGRRADNRSATRDAAGIRNPAKITRTRPWLFAGGSSATMADKLVAGPAGAGAGASGSPCVGC